MTYQSPTGDLTWDSSAAPFSSSVSGNSAYDEGKQAPMRINLLHLLILGAIALLLVATVGLVRMSKREQAREHPATATATYPVQSATPKPSGKRRCMRKCAAIHKGYVYRPEQRLQSAGSAGVEPEFCSCV